MRNIGLLSILIGSFLIIINPRESEIIRELDSLTGPSSVAALNTDFHSQDELNAVFTDWLVKFKHTPNNCETLITNLNDIKAPRIDRGEIINVEFKVFNECTKHLKTHEASFELVKLYEDIRA